MAISAYSSQGLLKKNPLLGTSLLADTSRSGERKKFRGLHERAKGFKGTKEQFQSTIKKEYEAAQQPGLESFAAGQEQLGAERTKLSEFQKKQQELRQTIEHSNVVTEAFDDPNIKWKKMHQRFNKANPELAREADEVWATLQERAPDRIGKKGKVRKGKLLRKSYKKGKRSEAVKTRFEEMAAEAQEQLNIMNQSNPELLAGLQAGTSDRVGARGSKFDLTKETLKDLASSQQEAGVALGHGLRDFYDLRNVVTNPLKWAAGAFSPITSAFKSIKGLFGGSKKAKRKRRRMRRNRQAAGQSRALLDEMALRKGGAQIRSMGNLADISESSANIKGLERVQSQQKKTLEDRANFFGSFFS